MSDANEPLRNKYRVERLHDAAGKHSNCGYFVLDPQHDPLARVALAAYSGAAREQGFTALSDDLDEWLADISTALGGAA